MGQLGEERYPFRTEGPTEYSAVEIMHSLIPVGLPPEEEARLISAMIASLEQRKQGIIDDKTVSNAVEEFIWSAQEPPPQS